MARTPRLVASLVVLSLLLSLLQGPPAWAGDGTVSGVLFDAYGRPAKGHALVLLDAEGVEVARAVAGPSGRYTLEGVPKGTYGLLVEGPDGARAVVAAPPLVVKGGRHKVNLRLVEQGDEPASAVPTTTASWWGSLPTTGKVWVIAGAVAMGAFAVAGLDDDDGEVPASPFE